MRFFSRLKWRKSKHQQDKTIVVNDAKYDIDDLAPVKLRIYIDNDLHYDDIELMNHKPGIKVNDCLKLLTESVCSSSGDDDDDDDDDHEDNDFFKPNYGHGFDSLKRCKSQSSFALKYVEDNMDLEFDFFPASSDGGTRSIVDDFSILWDEDQDVVSNNKNNNNNIIENNKNHTMQNQHTIIINQGGTQKKDTNYINTDMMEKSIVIDDDSPSYVSSLNHHHGQDMLQIHQLYNQSIRKNTNDITFPHDIFIKKNNESLLGSQEQHNYQQEENNDFFDSKSYLSYDDTCNVKVTPSIAFFLGSDDDTLRKEGLSIAADDNEIIIDNYTTSNVHNIDTKISLIRNNNDYKHLRRSSTDETSSETYDSGTRKTKSNNNYQGGVSISSSSKYTCDTEKVSELREKKRLLEQRFESRCNNCNKNRLPRMIEISKFRISH